MAGESAVNNLESLNLDPGRATEQLVRLPSAYQIIRVSLNFKFGRGDGVESLSQKGSVSESDAVWLCRLEGRHRIRGSPPNQMEKGEELSLIWPLTDSGTVCPLLVVVSNGFSRPAITSAD